MRGAVERSGIPSTGKDLPAGAGKNIGLNALGNSGRSPHPARQANPPHRLGFHIWRNRRGWPRYAQRIREAWWILTGRWSLHRAWQFGYDDHIRDECARLARGGR